MAEPVSLDLRRGEILGLAGLVGAGRTETLRTVFGLDAAERGAVDSGGGVRFRGANLGEESSRGSVF